MRRRTYGLGNTCGHTVLNAAQIPQLNDYAFNRIALKQKFFCICSAFSRLRTSLLQKKPDSTRQVLLSLFAIRNLKAVSDHCSRQRERHRARVQSFNLLLARPECSAFFFNPQVELSFYQDIPFVSHYLYYFSSSSSSGSFETLGFSRPSSVFLSHLYFGRLF